ncbi:MAG: cytochrome c [Thermoanaerobaculales bacterium]|jgi:mono/diheme cytochrome c family protein|nr:cytochrome c [Thermoanaerobaculales bacterium]
MRRSSLINLTAMAALAVAGAGATAATGGAADAPILAASHGLPASLDALYPPLAEQPEYLVRMLGLNGHFVGIGIDLAQGEVEHATAGFQAFRNAYLELAGLVPEWRDRFPADPVDALGEALASGDPARVGAAFGAVGAVCAGCHHQSMTAVAHRYHWPDANAVTVVDPVSGSTVGHAEFMHQLDFSMTGITHDVAQGQPEAARAHYRDFRSRFEALAGTCEDCHGTEERFYFTDQGSMARVEAIGAALAAEPPDPAAVGAAVMEVGVSTCHRCHLVHVPAAFTKIAAQH